MYSDIFTFSTFGRSSAMRYDHANDSLVQSIFDRERKSEIPLVIEEYMNRQRGGKPKPKGKLFRNVRNHDKLWYRIGTYSNKELLRQLHVNNINIAELNATIKQEQNLHEI